MLRCKRDNLEENKVFKKLKDKKGFTLVELTVVLVILAILLESLGFPLEIVGLVAGVHAFNDMGMTMINCLGDLAGTVIVGNAEKKRISA